MTDNVKVRFLKKTKKVQDPNMDSECWVWTGTVDQDGFAQFTVRGKAYSAHRYAFVLRNGYAPGRVVHLCGNKLCVRPTHLSDKHCPNGHLRTEDNTYVLNGVKRCNTCRKQRRERQSSVGLAR